MSQEKDKKDQSSNKQKPFNSYLKFSGLAIQMAVTIYLGNLLGKYLDELYGDGGSIYTKVVTLVAVFLAIFIVIRQVISNTE